MCPIPNEALQAATNNQEYNWNTFYLPREQHFQTDVLLHINVEEEI